MTVFPGPESTRPARFPSASMSDLVDRPVRYDLAESTCPPLPLRELLDGDAGARLGALEIGYGTSQGDTELRTLIAAGAGVAPGEVLVTAGGSSGMFLLAFTLCLPRTPRGRPDAVLPARAGRARRHRLPGDTRRAELRRRDTGWTSTRSRPR